MRLVIDLQSCQYGAAPEALALAQALARGAGAHEVFIAMSNRRPEAVEALRHAFAPLLAPDRVRVFELPPQGGGGRPADEEHWRARAAELVRENFLAGLDPDAVFLPYPFGGAGVVCGALAARAMHATVWGAPGDSAPLVWARLEKALRAPPQQERQHDPDPAARPRLAYVSPLPPEHSGIADYSAELVPQLARFYQVELVCAQPQVDLARLPPGLPLRSPDWFEQHAHRFERVLYHFGNSHAHKHMFDMIRRHPGIVVLHDFFFSGVLDNLEREGWLAQGFVRALYESHGYSGLLEQRKGGRNAAIWKYPLNRGVLDNASGVIVHSGFSRQLAADWYGPGAADGWRSVPLLRGRPAASGEPGARAAARKRLRLRDADYLVCSFGMLGQTKLNEALLDAFIASPLGRDPHCKLVFVGANDPGAYGAALGQKIAAATASCASPAAQRIAITGFVDGAAYADYLAACDCAVQLRAATRGETSAAVLDCLLYGVPTIVNAHGASAEVDAGLLVKLPDKFGTAQLSAALEKLHGDARLRAGLSQRAQAYMLAEHAPARVAGLYRDAIEHFTLHGAHGHYRALLAALAPAPQPPDPDWLAGLARAIAFNQPPKAPRQLLVDVSAMVQADLRTGIQRVVRSVLLALIADPPPGYRVEPVFSTGANRSYQYARRFTLAMVGEDGLALEDAPAELRPGDVFLGLDLFTNGTAQNQALLESMHARGIAIYFVVFDILPMRLPAMFPFGTEQYFGDFLRTIARVADGVLCISRAVADDLADWLGTQAPAPARAVPAPLKLGWFHLGADIDASAPTTGLPHDSAHILDALRARPSFLMVGTVEPRKGHGQALAAFERLWDQGLQVNLVIAGKQGWMVDKLAERMARHPERGRRLFWLAGASDEMLGQLYGAAAALLAPSMGEGFGLPLIEAARHGTAVIARDLPVFREVAGEHAFYFGGLEAADLAAGIEAWLALQRAGAAPQSHGMPSLSWREAARQLTDAILGQQWYREVGRHCGMGTQMGGGHG